MKTATAHLESVSTYSQSDYLKSEKRADETHDDYERRVWRERAHVNKDGFIFIPPMALKWCLTNAAKYRNEKIKGQGNRTWGKKFESGVLCADPIALPERGEEVEGEWLWCNADGKKGSSTKVRRCFPIVPEWTGNAIFYVLDETITEDTFERHLVDAGTFIGIGRFRPEKGGYYGRFKVTGISWS